MLKLIETPVGNGLLAKELLEELVAQGITEFCICPGARNAPLVYPLVNSELKIYYWPEERSAAFFALGRIKATGEPVAVVTTSGTAAAELLPAAMEAYYSGLPLVLITADRPRRFRGSGAPQSAEQVGLFGYYAKQAYDISVGDPFILDSWEREGPIHINVCFEEPKDKDCKLITLDAKPKKYSKSEKAFNPDGDYLSFLQKSHFPLVVLGALPDDCHQLMISFLLHLNAPVYAEAISGIREDPRIDHLKIKKIDDLWKRAEMNHYPIDGILRLGGVPTARLWRDLEEKQEKILVCSINEQAFSGLSWANVIHTKLLPFLNWAQTIPPPFIYPFAKWKEVDETDNKQFIKGDKLSNEANLIHQLSSKIPRGSKVYLGNSLPIREWDQSATYLHRNFKMNCSRGVNGIDGQLSTFFGFASENQDNWAIVGDLTFLYDLIAPWIASQIPRLSLNVVVINNGGGQIFARIFSHPAFIHQHQLSFGPIAQFWGWEYERWKEIPEQIPMKQGRKRIIELIP